MDLKGKLKDNSILVSDNLNTVTVGNRSNIFINTPKELIEYHKNSMKTGPNINTSTDINSDSPNPLTKVVMISDIKEISPNFLRLYVDSLYKVDVSDHIEFDDKDYNKFVRKKKYSLSNRSRYNKFF